MSKNLERKFTKPTQISKHLSCPVCADVFVDPMRVFCGHTFCKECIDKWVNANSTCPVCRHNIEMQKIGKDLVADKIIQELEVECNNKLCDWKGKLSDLKKHTKNCAYDKPPEWLSKFQASSSLPEDEGPKDFSLIGNDEYEERINQEVSKKSLLERLYTRDLNSKEILDQMFDKEKPVEKQPNKKKGKGKKNEIQESEKSDKRSSLELYDQFLEVLKSEDEDDIEAVKENFNQSDKNIDTVKEISNSFDKLEKMSTQISSFSGLGLETENASLEEDSRGKQPRRKAPEGERLTTYQIKKSKKQTNFAK